MSPECHISLSQIRQNNPPLLSSDDDYCNIITDQCKRTHKIIFTPKNDVHPKKIHAVDFARLAVSLTCHQVEFIVWVFFYQIIRSLMFGNHQREKNHKNRSQLVFIWHKSSARGTDDVIIRGQYWCHTLHVIDTHYSALPTWVWASLSPMSVTSWSDIAPWWPLTTSVWSHVRVNRMGPE